jgi:hypothetical protein
MQMVETIGNINFAQVNRAVLPICVHNLLEHALQSFAKLHGFGRA